MKSTRKLLAILLALCLFTCLSAPAFAVDAQYGTAQKFLEVLNREGHRYNYMGIDSDDDEQINASFSGDNVDSIDVKIFFDEDLEIVSLRVWRVISFQESDLANVMDKVNELNNDYKFIKFVVDKSDMSVDAKVDCPLRDDANAGEIAYDGLYYIVKLVDAAYPELKPFNK